MAHPHPSQVQNRIDDIAMAFERLHAMVTGQDPLATALFFWRCLLLATGVCWGWVGEGEGGWSYNSVLLEVPAAGHRCVFGGGRGGATALFVSQCLLLAT